MKFLNNREAKKVLKAIEEHWSCDLAGLLKEYAFLITDKEKLYMFRRSAFDVQVQSPAKVIGMYVASLRDAHVRLSIEGAQLIAKFASKNIVDIDEKQTGAWIRGQDLVMAGDERGFRIVRSGPDVLGCGYLKEEILLNYVPKVRRI